MANLEDIPQLHILGGTALGIFSHIPLTPSLESFKQINDDHGNESLGVFAKSTPYLFCFAYPS